MMMREIDSETYYRFMKGIDEEASWMSVASMTAYLEIERMTEQEDEADHEGDT